MRSRTTRRSAPPRVFISYSWEGEPQRQWVRDLAARLRSEAGIDVTLDQWAVAPGDQIPAFMEGAVRDNDFVLIVCTRRYRLRSNERKGGVGYEGDIMTAEVFNCGNRRKFIPLLRGERDDVLPTWLSGSACLDFRGVPYPDRSFVELVQTLRGERAGPPPVGSKRTSSGNR